MTLNDAKILLSENNIVFNVREFENETAYWHHVSMFPYTKNAKTCKVIALIIRSNNGRNDIELQFNAVDSTFHFEELWFGSYSFEMFDYNKEMLAEDLLDRIKEIQSGNFVVIIANDLKNRRWLGDACFDLNDDDDAFDFITEELCKKLPDCDAYVITDYLEYYFDYHDQVLTENGILEWL